MCRCTTRWAAEANLDLRECHKFNSQDAIKSMNCMSCSIYMNLDESLKSKCALAQSSKVSIVLVRRLYRSCCFGLEKGRGFTRLSSVKSMFCLQGIEII